MSKSSCPLDDQLLITFLHFKRQGLFENQEDNLANHQGPNSGVLRKLVFLAKLTATPWSHISGTPINAPHNIGEEPIQLVPLSAYWSVEGPRPFALLVIQGHS